MTEPAVGTHVYFRESNQRIVGVVREVLTAGRHGGKGLKRQRRRARLAFEDKTGRKWETCRDLTDIEPIQQPSLF